MIYCNKRATLVVDVDNGRVCTFVQARGILEIPISTFYSILLRILLILPKKSLKIERKRKKKGRKEKKGRQEGGKYRNNLKIVSKVTS